MGYNKCLIWPHILFSRFTNKISNVHENSADTLGPKYIIVNLLKNTKNMIIPMPISFSGSKMNTFVKTSCICNY